MGRHGWNGPQGGAERDGGREEPRKGPSPLPVRSGRFVPLHDTQYPTRLTKGINRSSPIAADAHALFQLFLTTCL